MPAVPRRSNAGGKVYVVPDIALVRYQRRSRVQADAQMDLTFCERVRHRLRRGDCPLSRREGEEEGISLGVHFDAVFGGASLADDAAVFSERVCVRLRAELVQEPRRALNIGEEERDRAGRKIRSHAARSSARIGLASRRVPPPSRLAWRRGLLVGWSTGGQPRRLRGLVSAGARRRFHAVPGVR